MKKVLCVLSLVLISVIIACSNPVGPGSDSDDGGYDYLSYDYLAG